MGATDSETFLIAVELLKNGRYKRFIPNHPEEVDLILKWFGERFEDWKDTLEIKGITIDFSYETNLFTVTYETSRLEATTKFMLADPDDDGNYPLNIRGEDYVIIGSVFTDE